MSESSFYHSFVAVFLFFFVSNAGNFSIYTLNMFTWKKGCLRAAFFFNWVPFSLLVFANTLLFFYKQPIYKELVRRSYFVKQLLG